MPGKEILLVLAVRELGLRSTLAARLSLVGADLITAADLHDPALERNVRHPAALILDEDAIAGRSDEWLDAVLEESRWRQVVVLTSSPCDARADPRLLYLERQSAPERIADLIPQWRAEQHGD